MIPPLAGIIIADYYVVNKGHYMPLEKCRFIKFNPVPWMSWSISVLIVFLLVYFTPGVTESIPAPFIGIVLGALFHIIFMKITGIKVNIADEEPSHKENNESEWKHAPQGH